MTYDVEHIFICLLALFDCLYLPSYYLEITFCRAKGFNFNEVKLLSLFFWNVFPGQSDDFLS